MLEQGATQDRVTEMASIKNLVVYVHRSLAVLGYITCTLGKRHFKPQGMRPGFSPATALVVATFRGTGGQLPVQMIFLLNNTEDRSVVFETYCNYNDLSITQVRRSHLFFFFSQRSVILR